jgi:hypothetical protein
MISNLRNPLKIFSLSVTILYDRSSPTNPPACVLARKLPVDNFEQAKGFTKRSKHFAK